MVVLYISSMASMSRNSSWFVQEKSRVRFPRFKPKPKDVKKFDNSVTFSGFSPVLKAKCGVIQYSMPRPTFSFRFFSVVYV